MATEVSVSFAVFQLAVLFAVLLSILGIIFYRARRARSSSPDPNLEAKENRDVEEDQGDESGRKRRPACAHWARTPYAKRQRPAQR